MPEPLAIFMERGTLDKVIGRTTSKDIEDSLPDDKDDTPEVIRVGSRH